MRKDHSQKHKATSIDSCKSDQSVLTVFTSHEQHTALSIWRILGGLAFYYVLQDSIAVVSTFLTAATPHSIASSLNSQHL